LPAEDRLTAIGKGLV